MADAGVFDAVVAGGGIVGISSALALADAGRRVALIERQPPRRSRGKLGFDARTVALSPASMQFLGGLADIDAVPFCPIDAMHVWERDGAARLNFSGAAQNGSLAWVAEHSAIALALWQAAQGRVELLAPATIGGLEQEAGCATVALARVAGSTVPDAVRARLVVAADGGRSPLRDCAGVAIRTERPPWRGEQRAVASIARLREPHANRAWQRFGASGPAALLPLAEESTVAVIWSGSEMRSRRLEELDDEAFRAALEAETEAVGGGVETVDARFGFPLRQTLTAHLNPAPRLLIVGDAARTLHPLAGQGVNVGLEDVRALAALAASGDDLGAPGRWRTFADARRRRSKQMLVLMRALLDAYCGPRAGGAWLRLARNSVVRWIDASNGIKAQLVREAMGLGPLAS